MLARNKLNSAALALFAALLPTAAAVAAASEFDCLIEPHMVVDVGSPEHGIVEAVGVERSDIVRADDVLVQLEAGEQRATVRKAQAGARMQAEIKAREASLALAERKKARISELFDSNAISSHARDEVDTEVTVARMQLKQARENRALAAIELDRARTDLERRTIRSPISGVVVERFVSPGEYVHEKPLLRVAQMDPLRIEAVAPADAFGKIQPGMRAEVVTETDGGVAHVAEVTIVDRLIDPASGTFGIRLELPNPDYAIPSGLNCQVRILPPEPATRAAAAPPKPAPAKAAPKQAPAAPAEPERVCRSFGPFEDPARIDALLEALGDDAREIGRTETSDEDGAGGYFVLTPAAASIAEAKALARELRANDVKDLAVLTRPPHRARISLGLYTRRDGAQQRSAILNDRGIETEVVPRFTSAPQVWLDLELSAGAQNEAERLASTAAEPCRGDYVAPASAVAAGRVE